MMIKKTLLVPVLFLLLVPASFAFEVGVTVGGISNPSHLNYGLNGGMGLLLPMVKFEVEVYQKTKTELPEQKNAITGGIKFRPKFGRFAPYAIVGVGTDFDTLSLDFDKYSRFTFVGGGVHVFAAGILSFRADVRFLDYTDFNRTRFTAGLFLHF
jgi:hypothetical protein